MGFLAGKTVIITGGGRAVLENGKEDKIVVFKYKAKKNDINITAVKQ